VLILNETSVTSFEYAAAPSFHTDGENFAGQPWSKLVMVLMRNVAFIGELGNTGRKLISLVPRSGS
jgi:hypothetical protein